MGVPVGGRGQHACVEAQLQAEWGGWVELGKAGDQAAGAMQASITLYAAQPRQNSSNQLLRTLSASPMRRSMWPTGRSSPPSPTLQRHQGRQRR